jgi:hypothetical protein
MPCLRFTYSLRHKRRQSLLLLMLNHVEGVFHSIGDRPCPTTRRVSIPYKRSAILVDHNHFLAPLTPLAAWCAPKTFFGQFDCDTIHWLRGSIPHLS